MKIGNIVRFNDERFFEGAVQLGWIEKRPEQALRAAESFVFHGPRYHGANDASTDGIDSHYRLKDTASFVKDLLGSILQSEQGREANPYWLVVAGYGSGKSHLALTCASLLSNPHSETANVVLQQLSSADLEIGSTIDKQLQALGKPALILPLDGMSGFHLGNALSQSVFKQLALLGVDAEPLRSLSPRFSVACKFVERNYDVRQDRFKESIPHLKIEDICQRLKENDEAIYEAVDKVYAEANGQPIPIEGQESAQELIDILSNLYCGKDGPFSQIIIMFDEFGRYLEYAAEKPHLAGDAALQQIFQGIQDNSDKVRFVGFIQYELKTYLKRFGGSGLRQLQRYITRFDAAEKYYLSTNLETIFAHMIHKDESELDAVLSKTNAYQSFKQTHTNLSLCLPSFTRYPVWQDGERFSQVIGRGCWPLHPMAVWFLTRQKDIVQSRSALTFIKDTITRVSQDSVVDKGVMKQVSAAELVLSSMLSELVAAEREVGGTVAETLQTLLEKFSGHLGQSDQLVLSGVATLEKMRIGKQGQDMANILLGEATALNADQVHSSLNILSELGALEWNRDLGQYELLTDGASRGQFQQWLRKQQLSVESNDGRNLFMRRAASEDVLASIETDFGLAHSISTQDWYFEAAFAHSGNLSNCLKQAFKEWSEARLPTEAKGKIIYLYISSDDDKFKLEQNIHNIFIEQLGRLKVDKAPIWIVGLDDHDGSLIDNLSKLYLFEEVLTDSDKERFRRFIPDEMLRSKSGIKGTLIRLIKQYDFWAAGFDQIPKDRLKKVGNAIFSAIYTNVLPFEFDGFATKNGGGNPDSATLMRGLITKQFDGGWVQSQPVRLRNRINTFMVQSLGSLNREGKLVVPREMSVKNVLSELVSNHQVDSTLTLNDSYKKLIRPPYGMNTASAGLMLSMLVGLDTPPRRLVHNKELISSSDWIELVFPKKGHQLNESILESTTLRFLSESSESRWRELFERWELVETYESQLLLVDEMINFNKVDPVPELLEGSYRYWIDTGNAIRTKVQDKQNEVNKLEKDLERMANRVSVGHLLSIAKKLFILHREFEQSELWPQVLVKDCGHLLTVAQSLCSDHLNDWIPRQTCNSVANLSDFRKSMEGHEKSLEVLGYSKQALALRSQVSSSIHRIEKIQTFQLTMSQCVDYPRQPAPNASTPVRVLRDEVTRGDELISTLKSALGTFTEEEVNAHVAAITVRQQTLKQAEAEKRNELGALYTPPGSEHELIEMLQRAKHLQKVFVDTRDEAELSEIVYQLDYILKDVRNWPDNTVGASRFEEILKIQSASQETVFLSHLEDKEIEVAWLESIYKVLSLEKISEAYQRSKDWTEVRYYEEDKIGALTEDKARSLQREIRAMPDFLADNDKERLERQLGIITAHLSVLEENRYREEVHTWLDQFEKFDIEALGPNAVTSYLNIISSPPHMLNNEESMKVKNLELQLQYKLDRISVDDILRRINQLPREVQREIIVAVDYNLSKDVTD